MYNIYVPRVFVTRAFEKWAHGERVSDHTLRAVVDRADSGLVDSNLKGCLIKLRIARPRMGKRGGYRAILAYRSGDRAFFLFGFAKNEASNIDAEDAETLDEYGALLLKQTEAQIRRRIEIGELRELAG